MGLKEYLFGKSAESEACAFLCSKGYEILERNFSSKFGEIDIIAKKDEVLRFIEVKATSGKYEVEYRVTKVKFEKILKAVNFYLMKNSVNMDFQIDLLTFKDENFELIENISL